jgi:hypothetical protein
MKRGAFSETGQFDIFTDVAGSCDSNIEIDNSRGWRPHTTITGVSPPKT